MQNEMNKSQSHKHHKKMQKEMNKSQSHKHLLRFDNGVYNLLTHQFCQIEHNDSDSFTTGYDYVEFPESDETVISVKNFLTQLFPDHATYNLALNKLASFLKGGNPDGNFSAWVGSGNNGKSRLAELLKLSFGDYFARFDMNVDGSTLDGRWRLLLTEESETITSGVIKYLVEQYNVICCCNHFPEGRTYDDEFLSRRVTIEFKSRFLDNPDPKKPFEFPVDPNLGQKLNQWKQAFMWILLHTLKKASESE